MKPVCVMHYIKCTRSVQRSRFLYIRHLSDVWGFSLEAVYTLFNHKLFSKVTVKTFIMLQKISTYNAVCLNFIFIKNSALQNMKSITVLNIDNNVMFLEQHISEDHVTLKTGSMMLKIQLCITEKLHFTIYSHRKQLF